MRFEFHKTALLIGAASLLAPVAALAQVTDLDNQQSDVRVFRGTVDGEAEEYRVSVPANSVMQIDVITTSELDPIVTVRDASSGETIAEDDDGGDNLNSRVRIRGEETGRSIVIAVDSFDASWVGEGETYGGSFDLRLAISAFVPNQEVTYGARETGTVSRDEPRSYIFRAAAGERVEIALLSQGGESLDPYLELHDEQGTVIASNDDFNGLNSYIDHTFTDAGTYTIVAKGYGESTGDYLLRLRDRRTVPTQLPLQVIGIGDEASGEVVSSYGGEGLGLTHIDYQLSDGAKAAIRRGDGRVTFRMNASEGGDPDFGGGIDPYLQLGFETPLGFAVVDEDDDGSGSLNAMLPIDLGLIARNPELLDMLRVRAQGFSGSGGAYTISVSEGMEARVEGYDYEEGMEMMMDPMDTMETMEPTGE